MNKNAIRRFAIYAREELIKRVTIQAATYGVTGKDDDAGAFSRTRTFIRSINP